MSQDFLSELTGRAKAAVEISELPFEAIENFYYPEKEEKTDAA